MTRRRLFAAVLVLAIVVTGVALVTTGTLPRYLAAASTPAAGSATTTPVTASPSPSSTSASPGTSPSSSAGSSAVAPSLSPSPSPSASTGPPAAPNSATGFSLRHTVVPIAFPLPAKPPHKYGDRYRAPRVGVVYPYEEARGRTASGTLLRAHDGVDIQVPIGTRVFASFAGVVVDPAQHWKPWDPSRYGRVIVIQSTESTSLGYFSIGAHLSKLAVRIGDTVTRGQLVGLTGITGNAAGTIPHLHFELRAPFLIRRTWNGVTRRLDVFDPYPSLIAADPSR
jgi:murein DD-endopeptidase MepM/ murein hydrolase activator NlpD